jgi:hypothetical protein
MGWFVYPLPNELAYYAISTAVAVNSDISRSHLLYSPY